MGKNIIAFQGKPGAYSDLSCHAVYPTWKTLPCDSFEEAFAAVREGKADLFMMPVENSTAGRVADIHHLLPHSGLHIIGEHYQPVEHHLLGHKGTKLSDITIAHSHVQALMQCRNFLNKHNIAPITKSDTAGAAAELASLPDKTIAAIASKLAGEIYGLESLAGNIADQQGNTTRFLIMAREAEMPATNAPSITSFVFRLRSVPAALYKALGGFASNGVNITKLESYMVDNKFTAAQFYADIEGHREDENVKRAFEELGFFAQEIKVLGVYPAHAFRKN
ncbi:MAG: prephenate dehydratase [Alphaproteobacteria bacterium]|nr:prephenate dehydratase [Alphaproteobacteria bacterium]